MLGCQDFCGYYDWTFHFVRRSFGQEAVRQLWAEAIGGESQKHYQEGFERAGLRGLYEVWTKTGEDEHCDWTFTLDESKNVLRWDMRQCPSKGFLIGNNLNADEDYCDHCMGWIVPLLDRVGVEFVRHEHNHCGQCWGEMSVKGKPYGSLDLPIDIRKDPRWNRGFVERWSEGKKQSLAPDVSDAVDSCDVLTRYFSRFDHVVVLGRGPSATEDRAKALSRDAVLVTDPTYVTRDVFDDDPVAVLIGDRSESIDGVAQRFHATPPERRPLLMHMYLPGQEPLDFATHNLPRPVPILPQLIRAGLYAHRPDTPYPTTGVFLLMLAASLDKRVDVAGIDLYAHPSGKIYVNEDAPAEGFALPERHSVACDAAHIRKAMERASSTICVGDHLRERLKTV